MNKTTSPHAGPVLTPITGDGTPRGGLAAASGIAPFQAPMPGSGQAPAPGDALGGCSCCGGSCATKPEDSWWSRRGRAALCLAGGLLWAAGFAAHAFSAGSLSGAFLGEAPAPWAAKALWIAASLLGMWHVFPKAVRSLRSMAPDMNLLMFAAVAGAAALGDFSEGASVAFLFALANEVESWSVGRARKAVKALMDITPPVALVLRPLMAEPVPMCVEDVPVGSRVLVRPGDRIPLDGVVAVGVTSVDQAPITGESAPVAKSHGDQVFAGTINADGAIEIQTTKRSSDTQLARILHMVEAAQSRRAAAARLVERFAAVYTPAMIGLSAMIAVIPPLVAGGNWGEWFYQALVVLVISCPCALVISTPVSVVAALASAARHGVLIKGGAYLEAPATLTAVALDKTGTLTSGRPAVTGVSPSPGVTEAALLGAAAALESRSSHPLARAVVSHARSLGAAIPDVADAGIHPGRGARGTIGGRVHYVGNERLLREISPHLIDASLEALFERAGHEAATTVAVWNDTAVLGTLRVEDRVRPESAKAVAELMKLGITRVVMLTGDNEATARAIAAQAGVTEFRAGLLPEDKTRIVTGMAAEGRVAMVGDGVNDAPAMAASSLGVAMGAVGTDVAIETADVALMSDDLAKLPWLIRHSRRTLGTIRANIAFALGLKAVFLVLAFLGMATLWSAVVADMGASLAVIFNGLRLLRIKE